jgi:hypothetical protein
MLKATKCFALCSLIYLGASAFIPHAILHQENRPIYLSAFLHTNGQQSDTRRSLTIGSAATILASWGIPFSAHANTGAEIRGTEITPFNGLAFQYRGSDFGGLKAEDLNEPSVPYSDFVQRLKAGEVEFVEFMAPSGDAAYVTFKGKPPIRIGEGEFY